MYLKSGLISGFTLLVYSLSSSVDANFFVNSGVILAVRDRLRSTERMGEILKLSSIVQRNIVFTFALSPKKSQNVIK